MDVIRYSRDSVKVDNNTKNYLEKIRDSKLFFKAYDGEPLFGPFVTYPDLRSFYPFQVNGLRYGVNHITPK